VNYKKTENGQGILTQVALISESIFILTLGVLIGILMPYDLISGTRQMLSVSVLHDHPGYLKYTLLLLAGFVVFHHHFCWMWLVRISNQVFSKKNWGEIYFMYTCIGLLLFALCFGFLQIFWM